MYLFVCLSVWESVCLCFRVCASASVCLRVYLVLCLSTYVPESYFCVFNGTHTIGLSHSASPGLVSEPTSQMAEAAETATARKDDQLRPR